MIINKHQLLVLKSLFLALVITGCGGAQVSQKADPADFLASGDYKKARDAVEASGGKGPRDKAIVALSYLAESASQQSASVAVSSLSEDSPVESAAAAVEMLSLMNILPKNEVDEFYLLGAETALGAAGHGRLAKKQAKPQPGSDVSRDLSIAILDRLQLYLAQTEVKISQPRVLETWNGCYSLLGGSLAAKSPAQAWRLYISMARISVSLTTLAPQSDLTKVLLQSTIVTVEKNIEIGVAVRCDLSSPFDDLRTELVHHRELLGRFESAVASATGCVKGTYAKTLER